MVLKASTETLPYWMRRIQKGICLSCPRKSIRHRTCAKMPEATLCRQEG